MGVSRHLETERIDKNGLAFWSFMTFLSGTANLLSLSIYRFGAGIGESGNAFSLFTTL